MRLYDKLIGSTQQYERGMTKLSADERAGILKRAGDILDEKMSAAAYYDDIAKVAAQEIEKIDFSNPEIQKVAGELMSYGAGLADGEYIAKIAMESTMYDRAYADIITKIAEVMGEDAAAQVDGALRDAGGDEQAAEDEIDAVKMQVAEEVAQALIENAGGAEEVSQDTELASDIVEQAVEIADQIVEEQLASE